MMKGGNLSPYRTCNLSTHNMRCKNQIIYNDADITLNRYADNTRKTKKSSPAMPLRFQ